MPAARVDHVSESPVEGLAQNVSEQALALARQQVELARRGLTIKAKEAGPGAAMVGGAALCALLASGTGTAALVLLLARRPGAAAALGVTGAYAGAGALLAREGLVRLREAGSSVAEEAVDQATPEGQGEDATPKDDGQKATPGKAVRNVKKTAGPATRGPKQASKPAAPSTQRSRETSSQRGASRKQSGRTARKVSRRTT